MGLRMRKVPEGGGADVGCGMTGAETLEWQGHDGMFGEKSQSFITYVQDSVSFTLPISTFDNGLL